MQTPNSVPMVAGMVRPILAGEELDPNIPTVPAEFLFTPSPFEFGTPDGGAAPSRGGRGTGSRRPRRGAATGTTDAATGAGFSTAQFTEVQMPQQRAALTLPDFVDRLGKAAGMSAGGATSRNVYAGEYHTVIKRVASGLAKYKIIRSVEIPEAVSSMAKQHELLVVTGAAGDGSSFGTPPPAAPALAATAVMQHPQHGVAVVCGAAVSELLREGWHVLHGAVRIVTDAASLPRAPGHHPVPPSPSTPLPPRMPGLDPSPPLPAAPDAALDPAPPDPEPIPGPEPGPEPDPQWPVPPLSEVTGGKLVPDKLDADGLAILHANVWSGWVCSAGHAWPAIAAWDRDTCKKRWEQEAGGKEGWNKGRMAVNACAQLAMWIMHVKDPSVCAAPAGGRRPSATALRGQARAWATEQGDTRYEWWFEAGKLLSEPPQCPT